MKDRVLIQQLELETDQPVTAVRKIFLGLKSYLKNRGILLLEVKRPNVIRATKKRKK